MVALGSVLVASSAQADSGSDKAKSSGAGWFMPKSEQPAASHAPVSHRKAAPVVSRSENQATDPALKAPPVLPLPPVPATPAIAKKSPPPAAVIGVISVPGVMQLSTAAQEMQQVLGARRDHLAREVQKEEASWRAEQQKLQVQARKLTSDQIQIRERHLQERRAKDQRDFGNKARIIQEAYQVAFHQLERELEQREGIIARVAAAHGMNLILHAEQTVLHVGEQDITEEVAEQLNKILPHVFIPGDGVDPEVLAKSGKMPTTADEEKQMQQASAPQVVNSPAKSVVRQKQ
ncbi:OmpH family outer membrane protein [Aristophania vespae]|uniref:OmpH family outer membrane protein n=2 Tax=Aristophania vespae TaxID=2697033 RepID=A0A6P1NL49_9PROT|nr:OmpH family outer membrane protein [Aristophania vespae]